MKYISQSALIILVIQWLMVSTCLASDPINIKVSAEAKTNKAEKNKTLHLPVISILPINPDLLPLILQLKQTTMTNQKVETALAQLVVSKESLNAAEQYLLLVAQALLKEKINSEVTNNNNSADSSAKIIVLLQQASKLSAQISPQQLSQPEFLQLHLLLADHYARQGNYELAYLEKKSYLNKYYIYRKNKRLAMIESLEQSFEVKDKKANNILMENQNELKIRQFAEVQDEKMAQQYNFILIICAAIVFVLLFLRQIRVRNKLIRLTQTDGLTAVANRSALFDKGKEVVVSFVDQPEELSVLLLDVDHFKAINDNFGHHVGDKVLVVISQLVKETMRSRDFLARLGGDEFVALLPFADCNKAKAIAMHINDKIAQYNFSSLMLQSKVTISIGLITMKDSQMSFDDLLHGADLAMHQAKAQGRHSVVCYQNIALKQERRANTH